MRKSQNEIRDAPQPSNPETPASGFEETVRTFRLPFYARVWTSNLIQFICFQVLFLAMQWLVTSLTPLRSAVGLVGFVQGGTIALASPAAGVVVDRHPKRNLIAVGRFGLAAVAMAVALLVLTDSIAYWQILVVSVIGGLLASVLSPATQTYIVDVAGRKRTQHAVALNAVGASFGSMGGGAIAGILVGSVGMVATYASASLGVALAAIVVLTIPIAGHSQRGSERTSALADLREGFQYVRARPPLLLALLACGMAIFNGAITPMRPIFARHVLGVGPEEFGVMSAVHGVGTFVAAVTVTLFPPRRHMGLVIAGSMLAFASGLLLYALAFSYTWVLGVELWLGFTGQLWNVAALTGFQLAVPEAMRGRVLSMVFTLAQLGFVGTLAVGALADAVGDQLALGIFGAIPTVLLSVLLVFGWKTLRKM
ncbi:MAG: MFS transporter [Myxococcota bacterium]